jgi:hypothetical protein
MVLLLGGEINAEIEKAAQGQVVKEPGREAA